MPSDSTMRFSAGSVEGPDPAAAAEALLAQIIPPLKGTSCNLAFLFVSGLYQTDWEPILGQIRERLEGPLLLGCTGGGVLGGDQELEGVPALSLIAAHLPRVEFHSLVVSPKDLQEDQGPGFWIDRFGVSPDQEPVGVLLPEPFSCDCMSLVSALNGAYPKMPIVGGLASGADSSGGNALFLNDQILTEGVVGVLLTGDVALQTIVSQGCRPIGRSYIVTKAQGNLILELAGMPAVDALRQMFSTLPPQDRALAQRALLLGVVMNEQKEKFKRGDFLIRNLIGMDPSTGTLAVGDRIQAGQTVQFQVRDAATSREDLQTLLQEQSEALRQAPSAGGLLFSCLGRGRDLYGELHHDLRTIQAAIGSLPIAGFFCNGEIGPIGGRNFIHGFTASIGLFHSTGR